MLSFARMVLGVMVGTAMIGCAGMTNSNDGAPASNKMTTEAPTNTELAAYAARHAYPTTRASDDIRVAAIASTDRATLRLYNFSNVPLSDVDVWVNNAYLIRVHGLPANGSVIVRASDLYNAFGKNFSGQSEPMSRVQIQTSTGFYNVLGPVAQ